MERELSLSEPVLGDIEVQALKEVIESGWITMGNRVQHFEQEFARLHQLPYAVAVNSCTAGLHLTLLALGINSGDEVLVPSLTFTATANAVVYTGATPKFVDIESIETPHLSLEHAKQQLTTNTRAVIVMHYAGYVVDMPAWKAFAKDNNLYLIEDAAHAIGAKEVGIHSNACVFSFFSNKNMTTAEGGMIITRNEHLMEKMRSKRSHGMTTGTIERHRGHAYSYDVVDLGFNYRFDELRAAIGLVQLKRLEEWNTKRCHLSAVYKNLLQTFCPDIIVPFGTWKNQVSHLMSIVLPHGGERKQIMEKLRVEGIQTSIHYPPIHQFTWYQDNYGALIRDTDLSSTEQFCAAELSLPLHPSMTESDVNYVVDRLSHIVNR